MTGDLVWVVCCLLAAVFFYCLGFRCGYETSLADRRELWRLRHQAGVDELTIKTLQNENNALRKLVVLHDSSTVRSINEGISSFNP